MKNAVLKNSFVLAFGTAVSRIFGLVRDILMAIVLSVGAQAEVFIVAFRLPNLFRRLFAEGAFAAGFIPVYARLDEAARRDLAKRVLSIISCFLLLLTVLAEIFMEQVVFLIAGGFVTDPNKFALAVLCARITFPYLIFMFLIALYGALLNVASRFWATAFTPVVLNVFLIGAALWIWREGQQESAAVILSWGVALAGIAQMLMVMWVAARAGLLMLPTKLGSSPMVKNFFRLLVPALATGGVVQLNIIIGTRIASAQSEAVAQLYYAERLYQLPLAMIGIAIGVALLPALSSLAPEAHAERRLALTRALGGAFFLALPATIGLFVLAEPLIAALFEYGAFSSSTRSAVAFILAAFVLGLPAFIAQRILVSAFFAEQNTRFPLWTSIVALVLNTALALWWFPTYGAVAIAFATALAAWGQLLLLWVALFRKGYLRDGDFYKKLALQMAVSLLMGSALYLYQTLYPLPPVGFLRVLYVLFLVLLGAGLYFIFCHIVKLINIKTLLKEFYDR